MSDLHHGNGRFRHIVGPKGRKAGARDWTPPKEPMLKAYCRCPGGDAFGAGTGRPCLITAHQAGR